jgi:RimJ/RimL family protein N-acetyltransferase
MNISIRPFSDADAKELARKANNPNIARYLTDGFPHPYTLQHAEDFITKNEKAIPTQVFGIFFNNELAGGIGIHPQTDIMRLNAELGYWVTEEFWGKGIATFAIRWITTYAFDNFEITRLFARPFGSNAASAKVLEKCGFQLEAKIAQNIIKNGVVEDELIYAIRKETINT